MSLDLLQQNLTNPPILFFFLGVLAAAVRSGLAVPETVSKAIAIYLLFAIGFKGGVSLEESGLTVQGALTLAAAIGLSAAIPLYCFALLRRVLPAAEAAATAACYGSISAVTFLTASDFLGRLGVAHGGHMVAAMALMESPAIVVGVLLLRRADRAGRPPVGLGELLRDAFLNGPVVLLLGSLAVGLLSGPAGARSMSPLYRDLFPGALSFFLLEMGITAVARWRDMHGRKLHLAALAVLLPLINAAAGLLTARLLGLGVGDTLLLTVLAASASYIAVPAAMRLAVPHANPSVYLGMALGVTFPVNISLGIPLYLQLARWVCG